MLGYNLKTARGVEIESNCPYLRATTYNGNNSKPRPGVRGTSRRDFGCARTWKTDASARCTWLRGNCYRLTQLYVKLPVYYSLGPFPISPRLPLYKHHNGIQLSITFRDSLSVCSARAVDSGLISNFRRRTGNLFQVYNKRNGPVYNAINWNLFERLRSSFQRVFHRRRLLEHRRESRDNRTRKIRQSHEEDRFGYIDEKTTQLLEISTSSASTTVDRRLLRETRN